MHQGQALMAGMTVQVCPVDGDAGQVPDVLVAQTQTWSLQNNQTSWTQLTTYWILQAYGRLEERLGDEDSTEPVLVLVSVARTAGA